MGGGGAIKCIRGISGKGRDCTMYSRDMWKGAWLHNVADGHVGRGVAT